MAPSTWHILREDGTTEDITTKVQLGHATSKMGRDERIQEHHHQGHILPVTIKVSEATYEKLSTVAYEQEVGLDEAVELVIQWGIWWRNS
jgi:hypothetical protein